MKTYVSNKLLSFVGVFLCIFITLALFGYGEKQWQAILLAIIIFGYGHFFLGFYYQLKSFLRKPHPWMYFTTFSLLTLFSVGLASVLFEYVGLTVALAVGLLYFLFHGLLNEQTLILRQTGIKVPLLFMTALGIFVISLLAYSMPDETFFFDRQLQFMELNDFWVTYLFETYFFGLANFTYLFWGGCGLSILILIYSWRRYGFKKLTIFLTTMMVVITALVVMFGSPSYIYVYLFVVGYHFMTWLLFYLVEMKKRGSAVYRGFVLQNLLILLPFIYLAHLFFQPNTPEFVYTIFDYNVFVIMTYVHISTSFLNDEWLQKIQSAIFARFVQ